jgi:CO/xanthine dehydrogenase FAD-binding subunit
LGDHRFQHAAIGGHRCQAVTPSDLGTVLHAFDASVVLARGETQRQVGIGDFYTGPGETVLRPGEVVTALVIPASGRARTSVFEKLALVSGDFAIASVTLSVASTRPRRASHGADVRWSDVRLVLGAVSPTPLRLPHVEAQLHGGLDVDRVRELVDVELDRIAHPLPRNGWKLDAAAGLVQTAFERLVRARADQATAGR